MIKNKYLIVAFVLTISSYFLYQSFKDIHYSEVFYLFKSANSFFIFLWFILFLAGTHVRTLRWKFFLTDQKVKYTELFHALNIGNIASLILPFRAGEFIRPLMLSKHSEITFTSALISVVIERVADVLGMFIIFYLFVHDTSNMPVFLITSANGLAYLCALILVGLSIARFFPEFLMKLGTSILCFLRIPMKMRESILKLTQNVIDGLRGITSLSQLGLILILTFGLWISYAAGFSIIVSSLGKPFDISVGAVSAVFVALAIAAPNTPGFLLTFEMGVSAALAVFAYPGEFSLALALIAHAVQIIGTIILGLFSLWSKGLSLKQINSLR